MSFLIIALTSLLIVPACTQQLTGLNIPYKQLGFSDKCLASVNTTLPSCPGWLHTHTGIGDASFSLLEDWQLRELCDSSCRKDLGNLRSSIKAACTAKQDLVVPGGSGGIAYPVTFFTDRYLYAAEAGCVKDPASGQYCDAIVATWKNRDNYTDVQKCSDCELGLGKMQLSSPFGYDAAAAAGFASLTQSCKKTGYSYATPTTYALNSTGTAPPPQRTCTTGTKYVVKAGDTCRTIAELAGVGSYQLINENGFDLSCNLLPPPGESICMPEKCKTFELVVPQTCDDIMKEFGMTKAQLLAWNPFINPSCRNLGDWRGWFLCASSPSGTVPVREGDAVTTDAPLPTNHHPDSNKHCGQWYVVQPDEYCQMISLKFSISVDDFYFLNPNLDKNCTNLWKDTAYCVKPVGNIVTYPGYKTTTAPTSFTRPTPQPTTSAVPIPIPTLHPKAPGTENGCFLYRNAWASSFISSNPLFAGANNCTAWASAGDVTVEQLLEWNPSLSAAKCEFKPGLSYCVRKWETEPPQPKLPHDYCLPADRSRIPDTTVQPKDCSCYFGLRTQDKSFFNCNQFPTDFNIPLSTLFTLNPWLGTTPATCNQNLWTKFNKDGFLQLCVERAGTPTATSKPSVSSTTTTKPPTSGTTTAKASISSTTSKPPTSSTQKPPSSTQKPTTTTTGTSPPAPTQPGAITSCKRWHVVADGDGCWAIADKYAIALDNFYKWNPGVGGDCGALWKGYAVCVGI
ncbi:hypothetical protein QBC41DRAFT_302021 [Cercophora samala]|uniref:LysM domain-containing protein n=1 Tax=Cercophora samala TaxID=330535 RepID=A0AA39ZF76_9PEZI|nr:hypothetical protein QBC41DRAFT_302021 [Cercophora samala]